MFSIQSCVLPDGALLATYREAGAFTDCYCADVAERVTHARYVTAFYTTPLFKLERAILKIAVAKPSTDADAAQLANGARETFAAWRVEQRADRQLLLCDMAGRTRSWLMSAPLPTGGTRLYFGSAVVPRVDTKTGATSMGAGFKALLGFHRLYSQALLRSAVGRLARLSAPP